jgi:peroxiredoxin Q/BCP
MADRPDLRDHLSFDWRSIIDTFATRLEDQMNRIFLSAIVGLITLAVVQATETQNQPAAGTPAPDFSLTTSDGSQVSLKNYRGKWVVLYFYPKDFTSGCTMEARNFQHDIAKYDEAGAIILGVSVDTAQSHKDFCAKEGLNFKLLADPEAKVSTEYGSVMDYKGSKLAARNTFIINPKGEIAKVYTGVKPAEHSEQVLKDLAELKKS